MERGWERVGPIRPRPNMGTADPLKRKLVVTEASQDARIPEWQVREIRIGLFSCVTGVGGKRTN